VEGFGDLLFVSLAIVAAAHKQKLAEALKLVRAKSHGAQKAFCGADKLVSTFVSG
jgi:hypothetical protein